MVQSLVLLVQSELSPEIFDILSSRVNPTTLRRRMKALKIENKSCSSEYRASNWSTYDLVESFTSIPTKDLSLRFYGQRRFQTYATGPEQSERLVVEAVALREIQTILKEQGIDSRMYTGDLAEDNYSRLVGYKLVRKTRGSSLSN